MKRKRPNDPAGSGLTGFLRKLGPGLITGASDDDPSGIATYSQVGAQFGYGMLWSMLFSYPLMSAAQEISARVGRVTGMGIAGCMRRLFPSWVVFVVVGLTALANTINLGADIAAIGAGVHLLVGGPLLAYATGAVLLSLLLQVFIPYTRYVHVLKWLTLALFAYIGVPFIEHVPWGDALLHTLVPSITFNGAGLAMLIAVLGTTISPYLFFWQASQEVEEVKTNDGEDPLKKSPGQAPRQLIRIRVDTYAGMAFSNITSFFIILSTAVTLHASGVTNIETAAQAAEALRPLAGKLTFFLFSAGIIGTGMLALPVLAGSAGYAVGEAMQWTTGLQKKPRQAKNFYAVIVLATLIGLGMNIAGVNVIDALVFAAIINGIVAVPALVFLMIIARSKKIMGQFTLSTPLTIMGWITVAVMAAASVGLFVTM